MWDMHDRLGEAIDEEACASLIESIEKHGQRHPVLGRAIRDAQGYEIELIYGARRLFASRHLGLEILVDVQEIDDREAVIEMYIENRGRKDISPYERGLSYACWLRSGVFKTQSEIATALGVSEAQISRLLRYAELPAVVVQAFDSGCDIREEWAGALAKQCGDPATRDTVLRRAREFKQAERREAPQRVYDSLMDGSGRKRVKFSERDEVVKDSSGHPIARLQFRAKTVHVVLTRANLEMPVLRAAVQAMVGELESARGDSPSRELVHQVARPSHAATRTAA
jgi:ParB family chromosome partitioning protein